MRHLEGIVALPQPVLVAEDALGETLVGQTGYTNFELAYPRVPTGAARDDEIIHSLDPPYSAEGFVNDVVRDDAGSWGHLGFSKSLPGKQGRSFASWVYYLAIKITDYDAGDTVAYPDLADQFGRQFNAWYSLVLDWTELWTGVVLSRDEVRDVETRGHVRDTDEPLQAGRTGWGANVGHVYMLASESAVDRTTLAAAFAKASAGMGPTTEWALLLRSRRAADRRIAVIEAATAAEVALTRALEDRQAIAERASGLVDLLVVLETFDAASARSLAGEVRHRLAGPRNNAVHRGSPPTDAEAAAAITTARTVLDRYAPLETPHTASGTDQCEPT